MVDFSALQRAEIAEIEVQPATTPPPLDFSALQRAEIAEMFLSNNNPFELVNFSALQRAEIAEMANSCTVASLKRVISVLFNEPKLLKSSCA